MSKHKHCELIKAWAEGATIEYRNSDTSWWTIYGNPSWNGQGEYRIKPEPKPDVVNCYLVDKDRGASFWGKNIAEPNLMLTFDGETGDLKAAEVL